MKKSSGSESGAFNPRVFAAFILCSIAAWLAMFSFASTPSSGTLSEANPVLTYDAGPFAVANPTPILFVDVGPECGPGQPCDNYTLSVTLSSTYLTNNPNASIKVTLSWNDTGSGASDYDLYIYDGVVGDLDGSKPAPYQSAGGANPEVASITPLKAGTTQYSIKIVPYTPTGETVHVRMELLAGSGSGGGFPGFGGPDPTAPGVPRYQNFYAPPGTSAEPGSGEFNIGFNPATGRIMTMNIGPIWRLTPPERLAPAQPECCEALWEDVTNLSTIGGLDPILWTDQPTGRTFASNSTVGAGLVYGFTDDDGDSWVPFGVAPVSGSSDHETIVSGPYPPGSPFSNVVANKGRAVYYCGQTYPEGGATCQRSDTLGLSYGPGISIYDPNLGSQCGGIHGHAHVGPDGAVYVPVRDCGGNAGLVVSTDAGITWTEHVVPNSKTQSHGSDPSIAIDKNNRVYFSYVAGNTDSTEGHIHVQVSDDHGATWSKDFDLGASHGIKNAVFPEAIAGDKNRAAVGFLGTDRAGNYEGITFPGIWYLFIATTYDGGNTWTIVNATPNDPVQGVGGIWQGGGGNENRNLLDFNEVTMDDKGRVIFGYSDGCVGDCVGNPSQNSFTAFMRVARQSGGKTLLASQDAFTDTTTAKLPKAPCLSGSRDQFATHLTWKAPDNGGANITGYQILRGTTAGAEIILVSNTGTSKTAYTDTTANPTTTKYYYVVKAINKKGVGPKSNEVAPDVVPLPPPESACVGSGLTKLTDPIGDTLGGPGTDLKSFQIAQPDAADPSQIKLFFTINTDPGQAVQPVDSSWYVAMKLVNGSTTTYKGVRMTWNGPTPTFESYTPGPSSGGTIDGRFVTSGTQKPAEPESSYGAPYDKVLIVVKASDLGLNTGDTVSGFVSGVAQSVGLGAALYDQMPNSLAYANNYTVADSHACASATPTPTPTVTPTPTPKPHGKKPTPTPTP